VYGYLEALREAGIGARVEPFLGEAAFRRFYAPGVGGLLWKAGGAALGYARRAVLLAAPGRPDLAFIHREAVPRGNRAVLARLGGLGIPVVYDLDDAIYLRPRDFVREGEDSRRLMHRGKDPSEVDDLLAGSDLALVGNGTLAAHAREVGARRVEVLPTPVDTDLFRPGAAPEGADPRPLVGWIGSPTATYCLRGIASALSKAAAQVPFRLLVVGASGPVEVPGVEVIRRDWSLDRESSDYASLAVGLYPLPDSPWTRGKCGYKALLYAASGVPCVASPVGVSAEIVRDGETGFHARTDEEWADRIPRLLRDPALRARMGAAGRRRVEEGYSVRALAPCLVSALRSVVNP